MARRRHENRTLAVEMLLSQAVDEGSLGVDGSAAADVARVVGAAAAHIVRRWLIEDAEYGHEFLVSRVKLADYTDDVIRLRSKRLTWAQIAAELGMSGASSAMRASQVRGLRKRGAQLNISRLMRVS